MRLPTLVCAAFALAAPSLVVAQTAATPGSTQGGTTTIAPAPVPGMSGNTVTGTTPGVVSRNQGTAAASGDRNQAVATTAANAPQPARGRNSFSMGQARRKLEGQGFSNVTDLKKDAGGVWRGRGTKDGAAGAVWLDYKGNIGRL